MRKNKQAPAVRVTHVYNEIRVYFGDVPHLKIADDQLVAIQAWRMNGVYSIEYTLRDGANILSEYDEYEKWRAILLGLDKCYLWRKL